MLFNNIFSDIVTFIPDENIVTSTLFTSSKSNFQHNVKRLNEMGMLLNVDSREVTMCSSGMEVTMSEKRL